ncbi:MAG: hypothetical protein OXL41_07060 [Nitrospinae bacterium]|nr:hypothetical protein [Nitrospinota bacterium]
MKEWWKNNWDKVLMSVFPMLLAGVIGFFSAIIATNKQMGELSERIIPLEGMKDIVEKVNSKTDALTTANNHIQQRFDFMKDRVELAETRVAAIKELTELQRQKTVNELKELLEKYGKGN